MRIAQAFEDARRRICSCHCPRGQCDLYRAGKIDHGDAAAACPFGVWPALPRSATTAERSTNPAPARRQRRIEIIGPQLWAELHTHFARLADPVDAAAEQQWLEKWTRAVPCGECRGEWRKIIAALPPDLSSSAAAFAWSVNAHNQINARLGKPVMAEDDARRIYFQNP